MQTVSHGARSLVMTDIFSALSSILSSGLTSVWVWVAPSLYHALLPYSWLFFDRDSDPTTSASDGVWKSLSHVTRCVVSIVFQDIINLKINGSRSEACILIHFRKNFPMCLLFHENGVRLSSKRATSCRNISSVAFISRQVISDGSPLCRPSFKANEDDQGNNITHFLLFML